MGEQRRTTRSAARTRRTRRSIRRRATSGFSLIELAIVVVLIGLIAAIAVPRMSRGSQGAADTVAVQSAAVLQKALDHYAAEHGGAYPAADQIAEQLTQFSDAQGRLSSQKKGPYEFGPYVGRVPPMPVGPNKGSVRISTKAAPGVAWVYDPADGNITANLSNGWDPSKDDDADETAAGTTPTPSK